MRVIVAGASGALGTPLVRRLLEAGHAVTGISRTAGGADRIRVLGASAIVADVLDNGGLADAFADIRADAVIHELTALKRAPVGHRGMAGTDALRVQGTTNLLALATQVEAHTMVTQSIVFGYGFVDHGDRLLDESCEFGARRGTRFDAHTDALRWAEQSVFAAAGIRGVALRYGLFYGGDRSTVVGMLRRRALPVASQGGLLAFVHHEDAAAATVAALESGRSGEAYNIVDDTPATFRHLIEGIAHAEQAPAPLVLPGALLKLVAPYAGVVLGEVSMRVSNEKAKRELGWAPVYPSIAAGLRA